MIVVHFDHNLALLIIKSMSVDKNSLTNAFSDKKLLIETINQTMPFGKYAGSKLLNLPEPYLVWFNSKGFPEGKLGQQLALIYEIKLNGLEAMLKPLLIPME